MSVFKQFQGKKITSSHPKYKQARWWVYKRLGKKIIHQSIPEAQTREQAEQAERRLIEALFNRKYGSTGHDIEFSHFADNTYLKYVEQHNRNIGAKKLYIRLLKHEFKRKTLADITAQDCRDAQYSFRKMSAGSVNRIMSTASKLFTLACEEGILDKNPMQYVRMLKEPPPRSRLLTQDEWGKLWKELEKDILLLRLVSLAVNLPLRRGQILAITPDAVDLPNGLLYVIASKGREPRVVPLNNTASDTFRAMINEGQLPFPLKDFRKRWHKALVSAGINSKDGKRGENYTFHDLRKEFASELIRRNVNPTIVQKLFAHSDMSITNVYMHPDSQSLFDAVKTLDATIPQPTQEIDGPAN